MTNDTIRLSPAAIAHFHAVLAAENRAIRLSVTKVGCSGKGYKIEPLWAQASALDRIFQADDIQVVVDEKSFVDLKGTELDFVIEGLGGQLKFNNPNMQNECGCGESFNVKGES